MKGLPPQGRLLRRGALIAWLVTATSPVLACEHPTLVQIPEASSLSWNRYETLVPEVQVYLQGMQTYVRCLREQIEDAEAADGREPRFMPLLIARNNAAVAETETVVELYRALNAELEEMQRAAPEAPAP